MPAVTTKKDTSRDYLLIEQAPVALEPLSSDQYTVIDPTTGRPYQGIFLRGIFADLRNEVANVNNRYYDVPRYLEILSIFKSEVMSAKGVYGEYEHPKSYAVNPDRIAHKIVDVWYDESTQMVWGVILLMDTPLGKIAQQIVKTGGQIAISARAAGKEQKNPDGSITGFLTLISTFDIVYYPGFKVAVLDYMDGAALNESAKSIGAGNRRIVFYVDEMAKIEAKRTEYISMNESVNGFQNWLISNMNESQEKPQETKQQTQKQQQILQQKQAPGTQQAQNKLRKAAQKDLSESELKRQKTLSMMFQAQRNLKDELKSK